MKTEQEQIKEMTKDEIKKALKCCSNPSISYCKGCPYANCGKFDCCNGKMCKDVLNLITEQEKEIERLQDKCEELRNEKWDSQDDIDCYCDEMPNKIKQAKIDVLNELKVRHDYANIAMGYPWWDISQQIDELIKEVQNGEDKS